MHTEYLDAVYLHDVEFVCTPVGPNELALNERMEVYGLAKGDEAKIWGEGDCKILEALNELRKMQEEGLIRHVGITGVYILKYVSLNSDQISRLSTSYSSTHRPFDPTQPALQATGPRPIV
jgi:aryl-alcohol dehydrogenase-like predicted oxidoreductase